MVLASCATGAQPNQQAAPARETADRKAIASRIITHLSDVCVAGRSIEQIVQLGDRQPGFVPVSDWSLTWLRENVRPSSSFEIHAAYDVTIASSEYLLIVADFVSDGAYRTQCSLSASKIGPNQEIHDEIAKRFLSTARSMQAFGCGLVQRGHEALQWTCDHGSPDINSGVDPLKVFAVDTNDNVMIFYTNQDLETGDWQLVFEFTGWSPAEWQEWAFGEAMAADYDQS